MTTIEEVLQQMKTLSGQQIVLQKQLAVLRSEKTFLCPCCLQHHLVKDCDAIQTHWYVSPRGCTGGDYWENGELQVICPDYPANKTRVLFTGSKKREERFLHMYLFSNHVSMIMKKTKGTSSTATISVKITTIL